MEKDQLWYLLKHEDGTLFGPVEFSQLTAWAMEAQVSPLDKISTDQRSWTRAPMLAELHMDYLVELGPDHFYGPTTVGTIKEFLKAGEIELNARITNCLDGSELAAADLPQIRTNTLQNHSPLRSSIRVNLLQRLHELEKLLLEERRKREAAERLAKNLEAQIDALARKS